MKADIALWLYGSKARGDSDDFSDTDLLVIGKSIKDLKYAEKLIPKGLLKMNLNFHSWKEIQIMAKYGSLFLHHLKTEGKCIYKGELAKDKLLYLFSTLKDYKKTKTDLKSFLKVVKETRQSLITNQMLYFDLSVLATVIRHCSILGCWHLKKPCFNRIEPVKYLTKILGLSKINIEEYSKLYKYKLYIERRISKSDVEEIKTSPIIWIQNAENIINGVKRIANEQKNYN